MNSKAEPRNIAVVAAVNNQQVLTDNLLRSPILKNSDVPLLLVEGANSSGEVFNKGFNAFPDVEMIIFAHQDVYLPADWEQQLYKACDSLDKDNIRWGVLGLFGKTVLGQAVGHVWDSGLGKELGKSFSSLIEVQCVDELLIVVKRSLPISFDEELPGFHLYGADICTQAKACNYLSYVFDAPVIHNSKRHRSLGGGYASAFSYMQKKWRTRLPIQAVCSPISRFGLRFKRIRFGLAYRRILGLIPDNPVSSLDPIIKAKELGYE